MREMLALLLEGEGHRTTTAEDGRKALELAARGAIRPDLVVADYNLPKGLNGLQVVAGLRETLGHEIPAIILTGDISTDTLREIAQGRPSASEQAGEGEGADGPDPALPRSSRRRRCRRAPGSPPKRPAGRDCRPIFVVDDDSTVREAMRDLLQEDGRTVEIYASSEAFLDGLSSRQRRLPPGRCPDARHERARSCCSGSRARVAGCRAIMITGQGDVPMAVEAMRAGAADFIEKPIGRDELFASIEHALEHIRGFGQVVGSAGGGGDAPRRSDRAPAPDHGAGARRPSQQEHCRRPRHQPAHGREPSRRRHEEDRLALAFGADPLGARRRPGHRGAISRLTDSAAQLVRMDLGADPKSPRPGPARATFQHFRVCIEK